MLQLSARTPHEALHSLTGHQEHMELMPQEEPFRQFLSLEDVGVAL